MNLFRTYRSLKRMREIAMIMTRHGFGHLVGRLDLGSHLPPWMRLRTAKGPSAPETPDETLPRRVRLLFEDLGPTFVKLGQILATRPDLIPKEFADEFGRLHDRVAGFDPAESRVCVERELGAGVEQLFSDWTDEPAASGSMAQVHYATLIDGAPVVVKVKRPGIDAIIWTDVDLLKTLAEAIERRLPELRVVRPLDLVEEFERAVRNELNFVTEASFTQRFADHFAGRPRVRVPSVYWDMTTSDVLTLERLEGRRMQDVLADAADADDGRNAAVDESGGRTGRAGETDSGEPAVHDGLARTLADVFLEQFFELGLFHADPHPGNIFVDENGVIQLIDFGLVGHLNPDLQDHLATLLTALDKDNLRLMVDVLAEVGIEGHEVDPRSLENELQELKDRYYGVPMHLMDQRQLFHDVVEAARRNGVVFPRDFILVGKSFVTVTGVARGLEPDFDLGEVISPWVRKVNLRKLHPAHVSEAGVTTAWSLFQFARNLPGDLRGLLRKMKAGTLKFELQHRNLEDLVDELDSVSNRLSMAIILASIIMGSSIVLANDAGPMWNDIPVLGLAGFIIGAPIGLLLVISILRSSHL